MRAASRGGSDARVRPGAVRARTLLLGAARLRGVRSDGRRRVAVFWSRAWRGAGRARARRTPLAAGPSPGRPGLLPARSGRG